MNALIQLFTAMAFKKNKQFVEQNKLDHTKAYNVTKDLQPVLSVVNDVIYGTCSDEVDAALVSHQHPHVEPEAQVAPVVVIEEEVVTPPPSVVEEVQEEVAEETVQEEAAVVTEEEEVVETAELPVVEEKPVAEEAVAPEEDKPVVAPKASSKKNKSAKAK